MPGESLQPASQATHPPTHASSSRVGPNVVHFPSFQKNSWTLFLCSRKSVHSLGHVEHLQSRRERHTCLILLASRNWSDPTPEDCYFFFFFFSDRNFSFSGRLSYCHVLWPTCKFPVAFIWNSFFFQKVNCFAVVISFASNHVNNEQIKS